VESEDVSNDLLTSPVCAQALKTLCELGAFFHDKGWSYGTSSNYSAVLSRNPLRLLITASGRDKSRLTARDFVIVDETGMPLSPGMAKPSAETHLHVVASLAGAGATLHTHSVWGTLLSDLYAEEHGFAIEGYEMLKGLDGVATHETEKWVEIFENTQNIPDLAALVRTRLADPAKPLRHGYLIRGHGLYTWGKDLDDARRHIEIFEFLFEVLGRRLSIPAH
jgi:methylthioribulose-1-phosphate dehydratase